MSHRIAPSQPLRQKGARTKRVKPSGPGQRDPRQIDKAHKGRIAQLPCTACLSMPVEVAHVRYSFPAGGKRATGKAEKPSDKWCIPLCPWCHRLAPDAQHNSNEREWWEKRHINPLDICERLYKVSQSEKMTDTDKIMVMTAIVRGTHAMAQGERAAHRKVSDD